MFWEQFADDVQEKGVASVLRRDSFTLHDVLAEDDVLQECAMSAQLLDYLERQETLAELVALVTHAAPADAGPERRFRDPFLACELLRFGHAGVLSAFFSHHNALLDALVAPLRCHEPLDALVAEYTSRVMLKLLQSRRALALAYVRSHGLLGHIVEHLSNASLLQLVMGLLDALTEEVEVRGDAAVTSELGNARLKRVLTADAAQWLLDTHSVTLLMRGISATSSSAANCLECVERVVDLCPDTGVALLQSVCDTNHIAQQLEHPTMTVELARLLQLQLRVNAQANLGEFAALLACVHKYSDAAHRDTSTRVLGSIRLACASLWASVAEHGPAPLLASSPSDPRLAATLVWLMDLFFAFGNGNLLHVQWVALVRHAVRRAVMLDALLGDAVMGRVLRFLEQHSADWPRPPCLGEVVQMVDCVRVGAPAYVQATPSSAWDAAAQALALESRPLAGVEVAHVQRAKDFVSKSDIDGIGERK